MKRTQIYLSEEEERALDRLSKETGRSKSQLIRAALDDAYLQGTVDKRELLRVIGRAAGAWKGRRETGAQYVDRIRPGRLAKLHRKSPS